MLRFGVIIVAFLAAAIGLAPVAAKETDSSVEKFSAFAGDRFSTQSGISAGFADSSDGLITDKLSKDAYSLTGPNGQLPSDMLAGGLDDDPYALDGRFNNGQIITDRFGTDANDNSDRYAHKVLRLSNGDVVMLGMVPKLGATTNPASGVGYNIGMVRYNAAGVKQQWAAYSQFTDITKTYYVYPNKDVFDVTGSFWSIDDVKELDGWIYILAKGYASASDHTFDVRLVRISVTGEYSFPSSTTIFSSAATSEWGVGMQIYPYNGFNLLCVVVGRNVSISQYQTWMGRYLMGSNGALLPDSSFGTNGIKNVTPAACVNCAPRASSGGYIFEYDTYIAGDYDRGNGDHDSYVTKLDSDGTPDYYFGFTPIHFPGAATPQVTTVRTIVAGQRQVGSSYADQVYVLSAVATACNTTSAGIAKLDDDGNFSSYFGTDGKMLFGGGENFAPCVDTGSLKPWAMTLNSQRLAIVGYSTVHNDFVPPGYPSDVGGPSFSIVESWYTGSVAYSHVFWPTGVDIGPNGGDGASAFFSVVADNYDSFYVVGRAKDVANNHRNVPMTARVRFDRIFGNGVD